MVFGTPLHELFLELTTPFDVEGVADAWLDLSYPKSDMTF